MGETGTSRDDFAAEVDSRDQANPKLTVFNGTYFVGHRNLPEDGRARGGTRAASVAARAAGAQICCYALR